MLKSVLPLSFIIGNRFFGIFIVLPVLSLYALNLEGANEFLVGVLIGGYAITQMIFQVPFGVLSDKIGRKKSIAIGLLIFIAGSFICAVSADIYTMIFGRLLQGVGAIGAVATAMISDYTSEENRSKAMAIMGVFIGLAFSLSMILSPILSKSWGLSGLFYLSGGLSILCLVLLFTAVPKDVKVVHIEEKVPFSKLILQKDFLIISITNLMQKMLTSIAFLAIPIILVNELGFLKDSLWQVYAISTVFGFIAMGLGGFLGDGKGLSKAILLVGVGLFIGAYSFFSVASSSFVFIIGVVVFFIGFNLHEPIMQSCATKFVKSKQKGAALGVFNAFGYFGSFVGGIFGGYVLHKHSMFELGVVCVVLCCIWLLGLLRLKDPRVFKSLKFSKDTDISALDGISGVFDRVLNDKAKIVKIDQSIISEEKIREILNIK
ncbi:MFS transporter [Campylobacter mucosalis]|uniref:MFS transporter n=1 Tax=Campylobacter mucosalis TaxID=202 RepID=UPI001470219F|nr:MFS transporter [Campylobacter mucosalis]